MLYFSDHGQNIINNYVAEVPFILWESDKYKKDINRIKQVEKSLENKYITEDIAYTLIDLSYIKWKDFILEKSILV